MKSKVKVRQRRIWKSCELGRCRNAEGMEHKLIRIVTVGGRQTDSVFKVMCSKVKVTETFGDGDTGPPIDSLQSRTILFFIQLPESNCKTYKMMLDLKANCSDHCFA